MKKIQFGIAGFAIGIMLGLLIALAEIKFIRPLQQSPFLPFIVGISVIASAVTGVVVAVNRAGR